MCNAYMAGSLVAKRTVAGQIIIIITTKHATQKQSYITFSTTKSTARLGRIYMHTSPLRQLHNQPSNEQCMGLAYQRHTQLQLITTECIKCAQSAIRIIKDASSFVTINRIN